jgi:hypothetical protein
MIFAFALLLLTAPSPARAGQNIFNGQAVLPHCQVLNIHLPEACIKDTPPEALQMIMPIADRVVKDQQVRDAKEHARTEMLAELDRTIGARKTMLDCFDKLSDPKCRQAVDQLKNALDDNMSKLRIVLALSNLPADLHDHSVSPFIGFPIAVGKPDLPRLSIEEQQFALYFQKSALAPLENIGIEKLREELNVSQSADELRTRCARFDPDFDTVCQRINDIHQVTFVKFRESMAKIRDNLIAQLPLTLSFSRPPVTDAQLEKALGTSLASLQKWREDQAKTTGDADYSRLVDLFPYADDYVWSHPEACAAAEENILKVRRWKFGTGWAKTGATIAGMSVLCTATAAVPVVCFTAGTALGGFGVYQKYTDWSQVKQRFTSSDKELPGANIVNVHDKFRDFIEVTSMTALGTASGLNGMYTGDSIELAATALEKTGGTFYEEAGKIFEKTAENMYEGLKGAAVGEAVHSAATKFVQKDVTTSYYDWLGSDAFTARVFDVFLADMKYK